MITSQDDFDSMFTQAAENEQAAYFAKGQAMYEWRQTGIKSKEVENRAMYLDRRSRRMVQEYQKTYEVFPDESMRNPELPWELHRLCASQYKRRKPETLALAHEWLRRAAEGYVDKNGIPQGHTARTLADAMATNGSKPDPGKPNYIVERKTAYIEYNRWTGVVMLYFGDSIENMPEIPTMSEVVVTIIQPLTDEQNTQALANAELPV